MSNDIFIYDNNNQLNDEEMQQIFNIFSTLQTKRQIKRYVDSLETCKFKYGDLGEHKKVFALKLDNIIISFVSFTVTERPFINFIGTHLEHQRKGLAKKIIDELKTRYSSISANLDSLFPEGIEGLL